MTFQALALKVDFHCRVSGSDFYVRTQINFTSVSRMEAIYGRLRVNVNLPPSLPSWSMPRYHWKSQCTAVLNLDPSALSCVTKLGWKLSNGGQVLNTPIRRAFGVFLLYRAYIILFYSSNIGIFFLEFNLKDYIEVQEKKKKYVALCSRPPQTAEQSVFLRIQVRASSQTKGLERGWKQRARLGRDAKNFSLASHALRASEARVRLLRHALPISLLILRKKIDCFAVYVLHKTWN